MKKKKRIQFKEKTSVHFDKRTYSLKGNTLSLFTLQRRMRFTFKTSPFHQHYLEIGKPKEAELIFRGNAWYFNLVLDIPETTPIQSKKKIGVVLGENNLAALSTGKLLGGGSLRNQRDKYLAYRKRLQSNGSQSAKQRLRKISGRERRHVKHVNHNIAKIIIEEALQSGIGVIVMEDLKNIRSRIKTNKRARTRLHRWAFDQLRQFIEYKAETKGIKVVYVNPAYTSQTCSCCKNLGVRNKHLFSCSTCGNRQHSDLNASRNLALFDVSADMSTGDVNHRNVAA